VQQHVDAMTPVDLWRYERKALQSGFHAVAGVDEAGRGPLAGPVVSAAVILPGDFVVGSINDSKKLSPATRDRLYGRIYEHAVSVGVGIVDAAEIDRLNILRAALLSMAISVTNLQPQPDCLLIDGTFNIPSDLPQEVIAKGDGLSVSIAAASIVAKVTRDRLMRRYDHHYPQYGFARHKGYPTAAHRAAIREFGATPIHRRTFRGVKEYLQPCP
jgi:ribonuclease HII